MKATWTGLILCAVVIYFGLVHSMSNPAVLLNSHALILVLGGTLAITFLTYPLDRIIGVIDYIVYGFLFRIKKTEKNVALELIQYIDCYYNNFPLVTKKDSHPFMIEAFHVLQKNDISLQELQTTLMDRRNSVKRRYVEDAKILGNIAKYPPHLGLLGAASGMIEMMSGLGKSGTDMIGASMAIALTATLWGVGLNNFVFLPLSDNSMKVAEDEIYLRDIIIECCLLIKKNESSERVIQACMDRLSLNDRYLVRKEYKPLIKKEIKKDVA